MSGRYFNGTCWDCGVEVVSDEKHDAFHDRIDRLAAAWLTLTTPTTGTSTTGTVTEFVPESAWQAAHDAGEDEELRVPEPFVYPGERLIASITQHDGGFGFVALDKDGDEAASGTGSLLAVIDMMIDGLEHYYGEAHKREADPECPFPIGSKVQGVESGVEWGTVTGWDFYPSWGHWFVRVDRVNDDGEPTYQLNHPWELELVPENPDTPPSSENPDTPDTCAVCGEPVHRVFGAVMHAIMPKAGMPQKSFDHAATLTPPERLQECALCGHEASHIGGSWWTTGEPTLGLCHGCDEDHDCYRRWTVHGDRPEHDDPCDCDDCRAKILHNYDSEPPVGAVARCAGCGNVYVHRADGWLATDGPFLDSWGNLARSFCGPVKVIYTPEEDK